MKYRQKWFYCTIFHSVKKWVLPVLLIAAVFLSGCQPEGGTGEGGSAPDGDGPAEIEELLLEIAGGVGEIREGLDAGMKILITGESEVVEGADCPLLVLGTDHEEHFVQETRYAVDPSGRQVYRYNLLADSWEALAAD